jgi:alpha-tubulin suppressor-like RCC1 family protein
VGSYQEGGGGGVVRGGGTGYTFLHRSSSIGSHNDGSGGDGREGDTPTNNNNNNHNEPPSDVQVKLARDLLLSLLYSTTDNKKKTLVHSAHANLTLLQLLLDRSWQLDDLEEQQQRLFLQQQQQQKQPPPHKQPLQQQQAPPLKQPGILLTSSTTTSSKVVVVATAAVVQSNILLHVDEESGYTPLHSAIIHGDLAMILILLRHAMDVEQTRRLTQHPMTALHHHHHHHHPSLLLSSSSSSSSLLLLLDRMVHHVDYEGLTPLELLTRLQRNELNKCRLAFQQLRDHRTRILQQRGAAASSSGSSLLQTKKNGRRFRPSRFDHIREEEEEEDDDEQQDELHELSQGLAALPQQEQERQQHEEEEEQQQQPTTTTESSPARTTSTTPDHATYACEVVSFGTAHSCTLGVPSGSNNTHKTSTTSSLLTSKPSMSLPTGGTFFSSTTTTTVDSHHSTYTNIRPQRIQTFAQDRTGRRQSAMAVAAATYHSLVVTRNGHLYAFGLGKGGRLGTSKDEAPQNCPVPTRVLGALSRKHVMSVAAAENHSLCVTLDGAVYGWGSNRFGQVLGGNVVSSSTSTSAAATSSAASTGVSASSSLSEGRDDSHNRCFLPRRVEDLKHIVCTAVAAGERHSVALSALGEIYVWGDNSAGQLGIPRRNGIQKVQRVEALWGQRKAHHHQQQQQDQQRQSSSNQRCIAIAASEQSTLCLMSPMASSGLLPVNIVFSWGHGNHVPMKVHFGGDSTTRGSTEPPRRHEYHHRTINPTAIACAKYHNVVISSDGHVYSWGLHAEPLGTKNNRNSPQKQSLPQMVTGMLSENGGGFAVAVAASEQHTAVVTDCGALYTWGATHGKNVLGHEGVRWQPSPKKVPGVHRAVGVAVAKEHTLLLIGTCFPPQPSMEPVVVVEDTSVSRPNSNIQTLEALAARKVAEHVDLFNVIPVLIMAERSQSSLLTDYCLEFVRRNLDGVLNLGQKSVMNQYINDKLADSLHYSGLRYRDDAHHHPILHEVLMAGTIQRLSFENRDSWLPSIRHWIKASSALMSGQQFVKRIRMMERAAAANAAAIQSTSRSRRRSQSFNNTVDPNAEGRTMRKHSSSIDECNVRTLDECIKMTANINLTTSNAAEAQQSLLSKEIRGTRKRLNQIARLLENASEEKCFSNAEKEKIARRPHLETILSLFEPALEEVEQRIKELIIERQTTETVQESAKDTSKLIKADDDPSRDDVGSVTDSALTCQVCKIKCPDAKSFELHQNGKKHRNRVAQAAEEEENRAAAAIRENQQIQQLKTLIPQGAANSKQQGRKNVWKIDHSVAMQPAFKLPPPPHPVVAQVVANHQLVNAPSHRDPSTPRATVRQSSQTPTDLRKIMQEQGNSAIATGMPFNTPRKAPPPASNVAKIPQDIGKNLPTQQPTLMSPSRNPQTSPKTARHAAPVWSTPSPGTTRCMPADLLSAPPSVNSRAPQGSLLADFVAPKPVKKDSVPPWSSPSQKESCSKPASLPLSPPPPAKALVDIQREEAEFKTRQDQEFGVANGGSWFIGERRERADSFLAIQETDCKQREERLLIEEQFRIEALIQKELELAKLEHKKKASPSSRRKNSRKKPKGKSRASSEEVGELGVQGAAHKTTSQGPPSNNVSSQQTIHTAGNEKKCASKNQQKRNIANQKTIVNDEGPKLDDTISLAEHPRDKGKETGKSPSPSSS